jgi:hypothetical protein
MNLYERNFKKLTPEDKGIYEKNRKKMTIKVGEKSLETLITSDLIFTKGIRHYESLFPNNFLDPDDLKDTKRIESLNEKFKELINDTSTKESDVLRFIKKEQAYHIIGSILSDNYEFGHHGTYLFPEFDLASSYKADYLLIGRGSGGHQFLFIEFEEVYGQITTQDGSQGLAIRKGLKQIEDWDVWLDSNYQSLKITYDKHIGEHESMTGDFIALIKPEYIMHLLPEEEVILMKEHTDCVENY